MANRPERWPRPNSCSAFKSSLGVTGRARILAARGVWSRMEPGGIARLNPQQSSPSQLASVGGPIDPFGVAAISRGSGAALPPAA